MLPRLLLAVALLAATFAASVCRPRQTVIEATRADQTLRLGNGAKPCDLDPHLATAFTEFNILIALGEGLVAAGEPVPNVASRWDISEDGLRYVFHLRPDAKWSNGNPLRAADFVFSFEGILRPVLAAEYAYMLYSLRGAEAFNTGATADC